MAAPTLIFCYGGNKTFADIAISAGYKYGVQLPNTAYYPPYFADQDWKRPDREAYMNALIRYRPEIASVLDWERMEQLPEVLEWAEEAAQYVQTVILIPKVHNSVGMLPRFIGGKPIRLGYSVPTRFAGTELFLSEFTGWPVHLLGGSPRTQKSLSRYLRVVSADGNMAAKMANERCLFFDHERRTDKGYWATFADYDGNKWPGEEANAEAFRRSCENIMRFWARL